MIAILQRVREARVEVAGRVTGQNSASRAMLRSAA